MASEPKPRVPRQIFPRILATAGVAAAVLLTWWWKVDDARTPQAQPVAAIGQPIDLGRSVLTPQALELRRGQGQIVLTALIENVTAETQTAIFGLPAKPPELVLDGKALPPPEIVLLRDNDALQALQPRLPEEIALIWPAPAGWQPDAVRVGFSKQLFKLRDNFFGKSSWLGFVPAATLTAIPTVQP